MSKNISENVKKQIFRLISIPGMEIEDIAEEVNLDCDIVIKTLSDEYLKHDLSHGRRLCCRF